LPKRRNILKTISELAELLRVSRSYLYKMTEKKVYPCHKIGSNIRFSDADIDCIFKMTQCMASNSDNSQKITKRVA
jgi:excisionase family DNA binding protein